MRWVEVAAGRPHRCAVIPFIGQSDPEGFIQTGATLDGFDNEVYVSVKGVRALVQACGWPTPEQYRELQARAEALEHAKRDLELQVQEADRFAEAAEYTLGRFGERVRNKPGRKPKAKEAA